MLCPIMRRVAIHARDNTLRQVFSTRQAFRCAFEYAVRERPGAGPNEWTPPDRHRNSNSKQRGNNQQSNEGYFHKSIQGNVLPHLRIMSNKLLLC